MKVVVDNKIPFIRGVLEPYAEVTYVPGTEVNREDLIDADALVIRTRTQCNHELLSGTSVKFIASATIGFDHIDTEYCIKNNISWTNAPGCNAGSVQQYIAAAMLHLVNNHKFNLQDKTLGIIGVGNVGSKVSKLAKILGLKVLENDPPRERIEGPDQFVPLDYILKNSDIISLHVPLNLSGIDKTANMVDVSFLKKMKAESFLINSSRGEVVEEKSLKETIKSGKLKGVILDVWKNEPYLDMELFDLIDIGTPHIAGYSLDGKANGTSMSIQALSKYFKLNLDMWYPEAIPSPSNSLIMIDGKGKKEQEIFNDAISGTYQIRSDDLKLRNSPQKFEELRGNYPGRREFPSYSLKLINTDKVIQEKLIKLGFKIIK